LNQPPDPRLVQRIILVIMVIERKITIIVFQSGKA
jgi:hypothetical protein